jgi:hypothetical protein
MWTFYSKRYHSKNVGCNIWWVTLFKVVNEFSKHVTFINRSVVYLHKTWWSWSFLNLKSWCLGFVGPIKLMERYIGNKWVAIDYVTKWVEIKNIMYKYGKIYNLVVVWTHIYHI